MIFIKMDQLWFDPAYTTLCSKWVQLNANIICMLSVGCMGDTEISGSQISKKVLVRGCCGFPTYFIPFKHKRWMHPLKHVFVLWGAIVAFQWVSFIIWRGTESPWWFPESEFNKTNNYGSPECKTTSSNGKAVSPDNLKLSFSWLDDFICGSCMW